jgi:hypothetical protein
MSEGLEVLEIVVAGIAQILKDRHEPPRNSTTRTLKQRGARRARRFGTVKVARHQRARVMKTGSKVAQRARRGGRATSLRRERDAQCQRPEFLRARDRGERAAYRWLA